MATRTANVQWTGDLKTGKGHIETESKAVSTSYSFNTRFGDERGSNPEELLAAAHAACFSMALSLGLTTAGHVPERIQTRADCTIEKVGAGFKITRMKLTTRAKVSGVDKAAFEKIANETKEGCPVSGAIKGNVAIEMDAQLE